MALSTGCAAAPDPPAAAEPAAQAEPEPGSIQGVRGGGAPPEADDAGAVADALLEAIPVAQRRDVRVAVESDDTLPPGLAEPLVWRLVQALSMRVTVLADATDAEALRWHLAGARAPAAPPTHVLRLGGRGGGEAWVAWWRLVELSSQRVVGTAEEQVVVEREAPVRRGADALTTTRVLFASVRRGDGAPVAALLDGELSRRWSRLAAARALTLEEYALQLLTGLVAEHGWPVSFDLDQGGTRAEVEASFRHKVRDVDFKWRAGPGGWRLCAIDDL